MPAVPSGGAPDDDDGGAPRDDGDDDARRAAIAAAAERAFLLYEGRRVAHRSCGIALAETFAQVRAADAAGGERLVSIRTGPYQALRRGGLFGQGECGAIKAGELILGEVFGDPDPAGAVSERLRAAIADYGRLWRERLFDTPDGRAEGGAPDIVCDHLTRPLGDFAGERRREFCTDLASRVAAILAEVILRHGGTFAIGDPPLR